MKEEGLSSLYFAMDPEYIPHCDPCRDLIHDGLHQFGDGLLRSEGAWLFYVLIKLGLSIDRVNVAIKQYRHWPPDVAIPPLDETKLKVGVAGGRPNAQKTLRMGGGEVMHFALHMCAAPPPHVPNCSSGAFQADCPPVSAPRSRFRRRLGTPCACNRVCAARAAACKS